MGTQEHKRNMDQINSHKIPPTTWLSPQLLSQRIASASPVGTAQHLLESGVARDNNVQFLHESSNTIRATLTWLPCAPTVPKERCGVRWNECKFSSTNLCTHKISPKRRHKDETLAALMRWGQWRVNVKHCHILGNTKCLTPDGINHEQAWGLWTSTVVGGNPMERVWVLIRKIVIKWIDTRARMRERIRLAIHAQYQDKIERERENSLKIW
jgi:hypothetical protein